jgi:hypothetical protein
LTSGLSSTLSVAFISTWCLHLQPSTSKRSSRWTKNGAVTSATRH